MAGACAVIELDRPQRLLALRQELRRLERGVAAPAPLELGLPAVHAALRGEMRGRAGAGGRGGGGGGGGGGAAGRRLEPLARGRGAGTTRGPGGAVLGGRRGGPAGRAAALADRIDAVPRRAARRLAGG